LIPALLSVKNWVPLKPVLEGVKNSHLFIIPHVQTQLNWVCNSYVILLWFMLPRDHFFQIFIMCAL
jgi:hypothetical protein